MASFFTLLEHRVRERDSLLCLGLDPHPEDLSAPTAQAARDFCLRLIEQTAPYAAAFKPNAAFFEALGPQGWAALADVIAAAKATGALVILDAKRGDIASTARAYARSAFEVLKADAITLSPYLGRDSLNPFLERPEKGTFLLCKTSNPGSADLQNLTVDGGAAAARPLYLRVAELAQAWNTNGNIGLVVGATHPLALAEVRAAAPDLWFLAPGVGAQGGDLQAALRAGLRTDGLGMLITVSRSIARADDPTNAARRLRDAIQTISPHPTSLIPPSPLPDRERGGGKQGGREEGSSVSQEKAGRPATPRLTRVARLLRRQMTDAERLLWNHLRRRHLDVRFRRQHPIGPYILDFYAPKIRLAIEVDGGQHTGETQRSLDRQRTQFLEQQGIQVLRFWNHEVLQETEHVLNLIWETVTSRLQQGIDQPPLSSYSLSSSLQPLADALLDLGCVRFGEFTLKSGQVSPIYIDLRRLVANPRVLRLATEAYAKLLRRLEFDLLAALPYAALPIGTAVSLLGDWPLIYPRKEVKDYGTKAAIEGLYRPGQRAVVLDDLITTGQSKLEGIEKLTAAGLTVTDIVVLIDRQSGGVDFMAQHGYRLHSVFKLPQLLDYWEQAGKVDHAQLQKARRFLGL